jgi:hypothetical protein
MLKLKLLFLLSFSFLFCDDNEGYVFELNLANDFYFDMESVIEFSQGGYDFYQLFSAIMLHEPEKPNPSTGEITMLVSFENVISSSRRNDEMKPDHGAQKLTGTSYNYTIDSLGYVTSVVGTSDLAEEVVEESDNINWLFGANTDRQNIKYLLGGDSLRRVGDVWIIADTTYDVEGTYGLDKFEGSTITKTVYTFKKIKKKGEDIIAVVKNKVFFETTGIGTTWDKTVAITQAGEFKCKLEFNITKGYLVKNQMDGALIIRGKDLSDDSSWNTNINVALRQKGKLK